MRNRLEQLRKRQRDEALQAQEELLAGVARAATEGTKGVRPSAPFIVSGESDVPPENVEPYDRSMSPCLIDIMGLSTDERGVEIITEKDQLRALVGALSSDPLSSLLKFFKMEQRRAVAASRYVPKNVQPVVEEQPPEAPISTDLSEALYRAEAEKELEEEEELFNMEENIAQPASYTWEDKWRPRKPRYFNRVHTGYEWNKYNQTHYEYVYSTPGFISY